MQDTNKQSVVPGAIESILSIFDSTPGRKIITGLSGLGLVGFIIGHLAGNLSLFFGKDAFNAYAEKLHSLGPLLYVIELGLLAVFVFHIVFAITVTAQNKAARSRGYAVKGNAGKPSRKSLASQSMIYTGLLLLVFTVVHVWMFKYGPGINQGYVADVHGAPARDLYRLVAESFQNIWIVLGYSSIMVLLGFHIRHGFWSAFQSLGAYHPKYTPLIYAAGILLAVVLAVGFIAMPVYIYAFVKV
jgi:succinate dehydrogenase / fumarate reductase cytochrome b subunit